MADDKKQPIVIKKIVKGGGHHGGAWKVAYADFVTAMMAFFLLLWLLGITDETVRGGIAEYFKSPSPLIGPGGASTSMIKLGGSNEIPRGDGETPNEQSKDGKKDTPEEVKIVEVQDKKVLDQLMIKLKEAIEKSEMLNDFKDQIFLEVTPEGLRIQILDKDKRPMFSSGSEKLKPYMRVILQEIAKVITKYAPNKISITGHTDAATFGKGVIEYETVDGEVIKKQYSNWELSADRANAARRELIKGGMPTEQVGRVVGLASSVLFDKSNPYNPINRRISIIVMNQSTVDAIVSSEGNNDLGKNTLPASSTKKIN